MNFTGAVPAEFQGQRTDWSRVGKDLGESVGVVATLLRLTLVGGQVLGQSLKGEVGGIRGRKKDDGVYCSSTVAIV